jgi:hypothetical protein
MENNNTSNRGFARIQIFSGIGMGLLIGIIVGLSVSEVASIILGALAALLAAFLGLQDQRSSNGEIGGDSDSSLQRIKMSGLRVGSFGIACAFAILFGVYLRTHNVLSKKQLPIEEQVKKWTDAGYDDIKAQQLVVYQNLEILPEAMKIQTTASSEQNKKASIGSLFAWEGVKNLCNDFKTKDRTVKQILNTYKNIGNDDFKELAESIETHFPDEIQRYNFLQKIEIIVCGMQESLNNIKKSGEDSEQKKITEMLKQALCNL